MASSQPSSKLKPKFDPIWLEDFKDLRSISPTAFIIRQLLRLSRDITTNLTSLSDTDIQKDTGFNRLTIRKARKELIDAGFIIPAGYHTCFIAPFRWTESVQPNQNHLDTKCPSLGHKVSNHLDIKCPSLGHKVSNPIYIQKQNTPETESSILESYKKAVFNDEEIPWARSQYPWERRHEFEAHLTLSRGFTGSEAGKIMEKVYPQQYTGKAV